MRHPFKRAAALLAVAFWLLAMAAPMATAEPADGTLAPFLGVWEGDDVCVSIRYNDESDAATCRIAREADDGTEVWEYAVGWYDSRMDALVCAGCTRYCERVDIDTLELVQDDWSMDDMESAWFSLSEDGEWLTGFDISGMDEPLELRWTDKSDTE